MWAHRYLIRKQTRRVSQVPKSRVNRHSPEHQDKVTAQVRRLISEERAYRDRWDMDLDGEGQHMRPARGVRHHEESNYAVAVCNMYLRMGPRRSLAKVLERWQLLHAQDLVAKVPTLNTLKSWSRLYEWQARAYLIDHISLGEVARLNMEVEEMRQRAAEALERLERKGD